MAFYEYIHRLRFVITGSLVLAGAFVVCVLITLVGPQDVQAKTPKKDSSTRALAAASVYDGPNAVTGSMMSTVYTLSENLDEMARSSFVKIHSFASTVVGGGEMLARGAQNGVMTVVMGTGKGVVAVGKGVANATAFAGSALGKGAGFMFGLPVGVMTVASNAPTLENIVRPAHSEELQIIDPASPELLAALAAMPPKERPPIETPQVVPDNTGPIWPINGRITAGFGVPHRPFQNTHTGIDISSGNRSGVTPVKPFRPGKVIDVINIRTGYGKHVIVDHGNGLTSLYGHLASINVQVGQEVGIDTVLGHEGTTGMSTGTHLHFEIRVNGKVANPGQFVGGHP